MLQTGISYSNGTYLPYAAASLAACALADKEISEVYSLGRIFCTREAPEKIAGSLNNPDVFAFSCYVWNYEHNKAVARLVKDKFPDCLIVFGGHNIPENSTAALDENPFVDVLIFGEGETAFREILRRRINGEPLNTVKGIACRENGAPVMTAAAEVQSLEELPSPYQMGLLDEPLASHPELSFSAILETNRGCPYHCAFCDWCEQSAKIREFPLERVIGDLNWMAEHKIEFCYCADANFGIIARDKKIVEEAVKLKEKTGYPMKFRVNFAKHNNQTVFDITKKLEENGLNKGATISFQSMTPEALKNIGRENMPISRFSELMELYSAAGISTYSELILGLPGESREEFCRGVCSLLEAGQHSTLFIYNCELIVNSLMAKPDYIKKHGIRSASTPLYIRHNVKSGGDEIKEMSRSVTATDKMNEEEWIKANMFSLLVQACHSMGLLRYFAFYLHSEKNISYYDFYSSLQAFAESGASPFLAEIYDFFKSRYRLITEGCGEWSCLIPGAGEISWPYEEGFYLSVLADLERFYSELCPFLKGFGIEDDIFADLLSYQRLVIKTPGAGEKSVRLSYDLLPFFNEVMLSGKAALKKRNCTAAVSEAVPETGEEFAAKCIWFGRIKQENLFGFPCAVYDS